MHDDTEHWRRLTILDILCLFPSFAFGAATVRYLMDHPSPGYVNHRPWPMDASIVGLTFVALVIGGIYAAPVSLTVQFLLRRRRSRLSFGEWFWLEPILLYIFTWTISIIGQPFILLWAGCALILQLFFSIAAFAMLAMFGACLCGMDKDVEYRWTDSFGCLSCGSCGIMVLYLLVVDPIVI